MTPTVERTATVAIARMIARLRAQGIKNEAVLAAMQRVPRTQFVDSGLAFNAYEDTPLPIGFQQTISQPFVVARMLEILLAGRASLGRTLEVGSGCGYQAAVMSSLASDVFALERIRGLVENAKENLRPLRLPNVRMKHADGMLGLPEAAPFDSIIVAAGAPQIPVELVEQLAPGARLLAPVGSQHTQHLVLVERRENNSFTESRYDAVRFVPLLAGTE
ncbi:MAG: protein-L-isoaspartate(D-aspartate) O-methyltransferase [Rhodocyclaceae bacterium]|nr:protein-L-isoaspartate(D-aspartate) O-methyltransferase [Rhodocyclaceae bacterium]